MGKCGRLGSVVLVFVLGACERDAADREYFAALAGEKTGVPCETLIGFLDRAIALRPDRSTYWEKRGGYRTALGELVGARADLDTAIRLADRPYLRYFRATVLCKQGRHADALVDLDRAIGAQPQNGQFYRVRALARVGAGQAERGLEDAEWMMARSPQRAEAHFVRGVARAALGQVREAIEDFDETLRQRPELAYPLAARADAKERLGDDRGAAVDRAEYARRMQGTTGCQGCGDCADPLHP